MQVLVGGASGLVGRAVTRRLLAAGHRVIAASRNPAAHAWPDGVQAVQWTGPEPWPEPVDAVVNLAGASIGGKRWSRSYKRQLLQSRLQSTRGAAATARAHGARLVSAGAIGYYGIDPDGPCPEDRMPGDDFLARLAADWEAAADTPNRVVFRFAHVLHANDGILGRLVPLYRARLGGRIGSGKQGLPWIHVDDVASAIHWAVEGHGSGTYNLAAPQATTQSDVDRALGKALGVAHPWWIPGPAMRIAVGGLGPYLVGGQVTPPDRLLGDGFEFRFTDLDAAMADLFP